MMPLELFHIGLGHDHHRLVGKLVKAILAHAVDLSGFSLSLTDHLTATGHRSLIIIHELLAAARVRIRRWAASTIQIGSLLVIAHCRQPLIGYPTQIATLMIETHVIFFSGLYQLWLVHDMANLFLE